MNNWIPKRSPKQMKIFNSTAPLRLVWGRRSGNALADVLAEAVMADQKKRCYAAAKEICTQFGGLGDHMPATVVQSIAEIIHNRCFFDEVDYSK